MGNGFFKKNADQKTEPILATPRAPTFEEIKAAYQEFVASNGADRIDLIPNIAEMILAMRKGIKDPIPWVNINAKNGKLLAKTADHENAKDLLQKHDFRRVG